MRVTFAREAARVLLERLEALGPDVVVAVASGTRRYHRGERLFAVARPLARRVDVGFFKLGRARSKRILGARGRLPFVPYLVPIEAPGDLDGELLAWLRESYDLAAEGLP
jgi:hypothetical protein